MQWHFQITFASAEVKKKGIRLDKVMVKSQSKVSALYHNEAPAFIYNNCLFLSEVNRKDC